MWNIGVFENFEGAFCPALMTICWIWNSNSCQVRISVWLFAMNGSTSIWFTLVVLLSLVFCCRSYLLNFNWLKTFGSFLLAKIRSDETFVVQPWGRGCGIQCALLCTMSEGVSNPGKLCDQACKSFWAQHYAYFYVPLRVQVHAVFSVQVCVLFYALVDALCFPSNATVTLLFAQEIFISPFLRYLQLKNQIAIVGGVHTLGNTFTNLSLGAVAVSFTHTIKVRPA